jgi:hypothetical protein
VGEIHKCNISLIESIFISVAVRDGYIYIVGEYQFFLAVQQIEIYLDYLNRTCFVKICKRDFTMYKTHQQKSTYQEDNQENQIIIVLKQSSVLDEQREEGRLALDELSCHLSLSLCLSLSLVAVRMQL